MPTSAPPLSEILHPAMLTLVDDFVTGYMALRAGVTVDAARATIETDAKVRASYDRKMLRAAALLAGKGGFSLTKKAHTVAPAAPAGPAPDVGALLAQITGKAGKGGA